jgi:hypothetical protein
MALQPQATDLRAVRTPPGQVPPPFEVRAGNPSTDRVAFPPPSTTQNLFEVRVCSGWRRPDRATKTPWEKRSGDASECTAGELDEGPHHRTEADRCITSCSPMPAFRFHLPFSRWHEPCCCRGLELRPRFTVEGRIGPAQQIRYRLGSIPWGLKDHDDGPPKAATSRAPSGALFMSGSRAEYRLRCGGDSGPMQLRPFCPHGPVPFTALLRGALFLRLAPQSKSCGSQPV